MSDTHPTPATRTADAPGSAARTVAITGAGGNIGGVVANQFQDRGWRLALLDSGRNVDRLRDTFPDALVVTADLTKPSETGAAVSEIEERTGSVDALAHLAGGFATGAARDTSADDLDRMLDLNLKTLFTTVQAVLPGMLSRGRGTIMGVAAKQALRGGGNVTAYAAAKGALLGYLRALRSEVEPLGLGVGIVIPMGTIDTEENRAAMPDSEPANWIAPAEMAEALAYLANRSPKGRVGEIRLEAVPPRN